MRIEYNLAFVEAKIMLMQYTSGFPYRSLLFECPLDGCDHPCIIPFHQAEARELESIGKVWEWVDGSSIDDLTLSPSYWLRTTCGLHCLVKEGKLVVMGHR